MPFRIRLAVAALMVLSCCRLAHPVPEEPSPDVSLRWCFRVARQDAQRSSPTVYGLCAPDPAACRFANAKARAYGHLGDLVSLGACREVPQ